MIQVELEVAAVGWARRQIPPDIILKKKLRSICFRTNLFTYNKEDFSTTILRIYYHPHILGCW
jgi:hypothetical protein